MRTSGTLAALALLPCCLHFACGSLPDDDNRVRTLAVIHGELVNSSSIPTPEGVRVAVIWRSGDHFSVAQDVDVQGSFPAQFRIDLKNVPPKEALHGLPANPSRVRDPSPSPDPVACAGRQDGLVECESADGGTFISDAGPTPVSSSTSPQTQEPIVWWVAYGSLVAYLDKNANGRLDMVETGSASYVDEVLGANQSMVILYLEGSLPTNGMLRDGNGNEPTLGFNLAQTVNGQPVWMPLTSTYQLSLSADPQLASLMCQDASGLSMESSSGSITPATEPPAIYPAADDPAVWCTPDKAHYYFRLPCTTVDMGLCRNDESQCDTVVYSRPDPVPADWPCK